MRLLYVYYDMRLEYPAAMLASTRTIEAVAEGLDYEPWDGVGRRPIYMIRGVRLAYDDSIPDGELKPLGTFEYIDWRKVRGEI